MRPGFRFGPPRRKARPRFFSPSLDKAQQTNYNLCYATNVIYRKMGAGDVPPRPRITKDMVIDAALAIAREAGAENINARTVARKLNCSTQPVMYHFATMEALKKAAYEKLNRYHTEYLLTLTDPQEGVMLGIGCNYIRFAVEEPHAFRFLFQSGFAAENSLLEMIDAEELLPVLSAMQAAAGMSLEKTKEVFLTIALFAHGYASILANHAMAYDGEMIKKHLRQAYRGAVWAAQEKTT